MRLKYGLFAIWICAAGVWALLLEWYLKIEMTEGFVALMALVVGLGL